MEILAAIALFLVLSAGMVGIFLTASNVYRDGEAARQANDEAIAALATIDDDLRRVLPVSEGGFFFTQVVSPTSGVDPAGNQVLAFTARNPRTVNGKPHQLIAYWIDNGTGSLFRLAEEAVEPDLTSSAASPFYDQLKAAWLGSSSRTVLARGALYLGVAMDNGSGSREDLNWSPGDDLGEVPIATEPVDGESATAMPTAIRLTLVFSGQVGKQDQSLSPTGFVVREESDGILVGGIRGVPVGENGWVRLGEPVVSKRDANASPTWGEPEWIRIDSAAGNRLTLGTHGPARALRNTEQSAHQRGEPVAWGTTYSLVRRLLP